ncbi:MAG: hypothetical protein J5714_02670 [Alphaproteobacteria bacterium]|nr:hypothetical protein [Alphaproteobacteria bacterium]
MANEQNLKILTPNEARELGRIGGQMSGKARRERKRLRDMAMSMASAPMHFDNDYSRNRFIEKYHIDNPTIIDGILAQLVSSALYGDMAAIKLFLSLTADTPSQYAPFIPGTITKQKFKVSYEAQKQNFE